MPRPGADRFAEDPRTRGRVLGGQYRVLKKIVSVSFSDVYCCEDQLVRGKGKVALKKLNLSNRAELAACRKEVEAMKSVEHVRLPLLPLPPAPPLGDAHLILPTEVTNPPLIPRTSLRPSETMTAFMI